MHEDVDDTSRGQTGGQQSETFVILPVYCIQVVPPAQHPVLDSKCAVQKRQQRRVKMALVSLGSHSFWRSSPPVFDFTGETWRKRGGDMQPQVSTSLADKSKLSLRPLTLEVAMEPSSQAIDGACRGGGWISAGWG